MRTSSARAPRTVEPRVPSASWVSSAVSSLRSAARLAVLLLATWPELTAGPLPHSGALSAALQAPAPVGSEPLTFPDSPIASPASLSTAVAGRIEGLLAEPPFHEVLWGIVVLDAVTGEVLLERNPDLRFVPASGVKIPVAAAALELLGPGFRWRTTFLTDAPPVEGIVDGDLIIVPTGDPTLGAPHFSPPESAIEALRRAVSDAGVQRVRGSIVLDVSAWDSTTVVPTWMLEDLDPAYGASGGAFSIRGGELEIDLTAGAVVGAPAIVAWRPRGRLPFVESQVITGPPGSTTELFPGYLPESRRWVVTGTLPIGRTARLNLMQRDPVRLAADVLESQFREGGLEAAGETRLVWDRDLVVGPGCLSASLTACPALHHLTTHFSAPLEVVVTESLAQSHNWTAEQLLRTLGAELGDEGSTVAGIEVVSRYLVERVGIDSLSFHLRDGSGLSAFNLFTPRAMTQLLVHARSRPWGRNLRNAMARPGQEGTLENRLGGLEGRVFAKTGTISHVNGLSGYIETADGHEVAFTILTNASNLPAARMRSQIDRIVRELAGP